MNQLIDERRFIHVRKVLCSQLFKALNANRQFFSHSFAHFSFVSAVSSFAGLNVGRLPELLLSEAWMRQTVAARQSLSPLPSIGRN